MYGLVLMTAWATAPEVPAFHGYFRDLLARWSMAGCQGTETLSPRYGCMGSCSGTFYAGGCTGAAYSFGCYGTAWRNGCAGCQGGGLFERIRRFFSGSGSCAGCAGYYSAGCSGWSYRTSCSGGTVGACYGSPVYGYVPTFSGGTSCQGGWAPWAPAPLPESPPPPPAGPPPSIPYAPPEAAPPPPGSVYRGPETSGPPLTYATAANSALRATVVVHLPADARLFAEGRLLRQSGPQRTFVTPPLPAHKDHTYRFRVEYERDGETISVTRTVQVRPGQTTQLTFADLTSRTTVEPTTSAAGSSAPASTTGSPNTPSTPTTAAPKDKATQSRTASSSPSGPEKAAEGASPSSPAKENVPPAGNGHRTPLSGPEAPARSASAVIPGHTTTARFAPTTLPKSDSHTSQSEDSAVALPSAVPPSVHPTTAQATLIVKVPPGATLYVNERPVPPSSQTLRHFRTPPLPTGQEFVYLFRVEYVRQGQRETLTQRVPFRPGERLELDLTPPP